VSRDDYVRVKRSCPTADAVTTAAHEIKRTSSHPNTMMIVALDADVAIGTVCTTWWLIGFAEITPKLYHGQEWEDTEQRPCVSSRQKSKS
jgi:hypothetical protein